MHKRFIFQTVLPIILILAVVFSLTNSFLLWERAADWKEAQKVIAQELQPAHLELVEITLNNCDFCFKLDTSIAELKKQNVNITSETELNFDSEIAKALIARYQITKLPALLVAGEVNKSSLNNYFSQHGEFKDNRFVYTAQKAPYYDVQLKKVVGIVSLLQFTDTSCTKCTDLSPLPKSLQDQGVFIRTNKIIPYMGTEGQRYIQQFSLTEIPALLISTDINFYPEIAKQLQDAGTRQQEGYYIVPAKLPPYRDLKENKIVGLVKVTYLTAPACANCYDVSINKDILQRFGMAIASEENVVYDSPQGQQLVKQYNITKVPIILVAPEARVYPIFLQAWRAVGSVEDDGWYVMRKPEVLGVYKDLLTQNTVTPKP